MKKLLLAIAVILALPGAAALAATPDEAVADLADQGYYVEPGARPISVAALSDVVADARNRGFRLMVAVLDEEPAGGPTAFADAIVDRVGDGTVLVLTRDSFVGLSSEEFSQPQLEAALDVADAEGGDDLAYARNFSAALTGAGAPAPEPAPTPEPADSGSGGGGGGGGLLILVGIVLVLVLVVVFVVRRSNKKREQRVAGELEQARAEIQSQLDAMANDILDLSDVVGKSPEATEHYQQATAAYDAATDEFPKADDFASIEALAAKLDHATWQLDAAEALAEGKEPPPKPAPQETARCFFDPAHRGPFETAELQTPAGTKQVRVCQTDAEKLRRGQVPDARTITVGGQRVPAPMAPRSRGGGGFGWMDAFSILVGGMGSGLPVRWGGGTAGRRAVRRSSRSSSRSPTSWPGRSSGRSVSRSSGRSASRSSGRARTPARTRSRSSSGTRARTGRRRRR